MKALIHETSQILTQFRENCISGHSRVRIAEADTLYQPDAHQSVHDCPEIFLQISGENHFTFPDHRQVLGPGDCLYMPAGVPHSEQVQKTGGEEFRLLVLTLPTDRCSFIHAKGSAQVPFPVIDQVFTTPNPHSRALQDLLSATERFLQTPETRSTGTALFACLLEHLCGYLRLPAAADWAPPAQDLASRAAQVVQARYYKPDCQVASIARELGVSPNHLSTCFCRATGKRLSRHLLQIRLDHACSLLTETDLRIVEVAVRSGFTDCSHFIARFKNRMGLTPLQYRTRRLT